MNIEDLRRVLTPEQVAKWRAFRQLQPDGMERLIEVCKIGFSLLANAWGAHCEPDDLEPYPEKRTPELEASPNQAAKIAGMVLGSKQHG